MPILAASALLACGAFRANADGPPNAGEAPPPTFVSPPTTLRALKAALGAPTAPKRELPPTLSSSSGIETPMPILPEFPARDRDGATDKKGLEPAADTAKADAAKAPLDTARQRCILLADGAVFEAYVKQDSSGAYFASNGSSATRFPPERVLHIADTRLELHQFLRSRFDENDHDERLKLARWCLSHELREQALSEARQILAAVPAHAEAKAFVAALEKPERQTARRSPIVSAATGAGEFGGDAVAQFSGRIQSILANKCGNCHASPRCPGDYHLVRTLDRHLNQAMTARNLRATIAFIDLRRPLVSPLLAKAIEVHGNAKSPPLGGPLDPRFRDLRDWAVSVAKSRSEAWTEGMDPKLAEFAGGANAALVMEDRFTAPFKGRTPGKMMPAGAKGRTGFGPTAADDAPAETPKEMPKRGARAATKQKPAAKSEDEELFAAPPPPKSARKTTPAAAEAKSAGDPFDPAGFNGEK